MVDDASRVVRIVYALNRVWQPTHKRLATRTSQLVAAEIAVLARGAVANERLCVPRKRRRRGYGSKQ